MVAVKEEATLQEKLDAAYDALGIIEGITFEDIEHADKISEIYKVAHSVRLRPIYCYASHDDWRQEAQEWKEALMKFGVISFEKPEEQVEKLKRLAQTGVAE